MLNIRRRTGYLFAAVLVVHVVLISAQINTQRGVPVLEAATIGVFAEVQRVAASAVETTRALWGSYLGLRQVKRENERLEQEIVALRFGIQEQRAMAQQALSLERLLALQEQEPLATEAASIIAGAASPNFRTVTIDKGTRHGVERDMAVIAPSGVVGRVFQPTGRAAMVQLLIDRNAAAGAMIERSRVQGLVVGTGSAELRFDYVPGTASVEPGDLLVTSGIDGIYPKGFMLGQIESVERLGYEFGTIAVRPAVDFSTLESVLVVTERSLAPVEVQH